MALAILELLSIEKANVRFQIDTGTNRYYQFKVGKNVQKQNGTNWVDEVYYTTPMAANEASANLLQSSREVRLPVSKLERGSVYVQLYSFKNPQGKSPAFSNVLKVPVGASAPVANGAPGLVDYVPPFSKVMSMNTTTADFQTARKIPCKTAPEAYSQQASIEDLLSGIVKFAGPIVANLLKGAQNGSQPNGSSGTSGANDASGQPDLLATLLKTVLGALQGSDIPAGNVVPAGNVAPTGSVVPAGTANPAASGQQSVQLSLASQAYGSNRFMEHRQERFARPFIFGIDDALIGAIAGPFIQILPQLLNSVNQNRLQMKQENNKLVTDILSDVNKRLLLSQLQNTLQNTQQQPATAPIDESQISQVIQMLQQAGAAQPAAQTAQAKSLSMDYPPASNLSSKAMLSFVTADPLNWNGMKKVLFTKDHGLQLKIQLNVAPPVPSTALPKAILKLTFKDCYSQAVLAEKTIQQKNLQPNSAIPFAVTAAEIANLPVNKTINVFAELRWLGSSSRNEHKALGCQEIVLVNEYFLKEQGQELAVEKELVDMKTFRSFWNKMWEAPVMDAAGGTNAANGGPKKLLWALDVNARYTVLLSSEHSSNGVMETKTLLGAPDDDSVTAKTEGRMKAGIELSITEMNKLLPLWDGEAPLEPEKLEALNTCTFAKNNAGEFTYHFKLKGKAANRGMVWVIPVFKLYNCTLGKVERTDEASQVLSALDVPVHFPLPVSARVIGLKSDTTY